ncbi:MAG TPA: peptidoglycan binding domain-containing protein, partial [Aquihabitans sp.]|nr:peptidoglycan binding domain-containing protein [Aquihabitans sp.]
MRRPRLRLVLGIAIPLLVVATLLATWAIDTSSASGKVPRNVTLAGRDIGRFPEDDLAATVADLAEEQADVEVRIRTEDQTYTSTAGDLGLQLDEEATVRDALELDRERALVARPALWLTSFLDERPAPLTFTLDEAQLQAGLDDLGGNAESTEPSVVPTGDGFGIVSGSAGRQISPEGVGDRLVQLAEEGAPLVVDADTVDADPDVSDQEAQQLADALTAGTADGLAVTAGDQKVTVPAPTVRSWVGSEVADGTITATLDAEKALADLQQLLPGTTEAKDASFTVADGAVQLIPSV